VQGFSSSAVNTTNHAYVQGCVNLLDCLVLVMPCPNCGIEGRLVFSKALQIQESDVHIAILLLVVGL